MAWLPLTSFRALNGTIRGCHRFIVEGASGGGRMSHPAYNIPSFTIWIFINIHTGTKKFSSVARFRSQVGLISVCPLYGGSGVTPVAYPRHSNEPKIVLFPNSPIVAEVIQSFNRSRSGDKGTSYHFGKAIMCSSNATLYPKLARIEQGALDINGNYIGMNGNPPEMTGTIIHAKNNSAKRFNANQPNDAFRKRIAQYRYYGVKTMIPVYSLDDAKLHSYVKSKLNIKDNIKVKNYTEKTIEVTDETYWVKFLNYVFPTRKEKDLTFTLENKKYELDYINRVIIDLETNEKLAGIETSNGIFALDKTAYIKSKLNNKYNDYINKFINKVKKKQFKITWNYGNYNQTVERLPYTPEIEALNPIFPDSVNSIILKDFGDITTNGQFKVHGTETYKLLNSDKGSQVYVHQKNLENKSPDDDGYTEDGDKAQVNTIENTAIEIPYWSRVSPTSFPEIKEDATEEENKLIMDMIEARTDTSGNLNSKLIYKYMEYPIFKNFNLLEYKEEQGINPTIVLNMNITNEEQVGKYYNIKCKPMFCVKEITTKAKIQVGKKETIDKNNYDDLQGDDSDDDNDVDVDAWGNLSDGITETKTLEETLTEVEFCPYFYFYPHINDPALEFTVRVTWTSLNTDYNPPRNVDYKVDLWKYESPEEIEFNFMYSSQHFLEKYSDGIKGIYIEYEFEGKEYTEIIEDVDIVEFKDNTHSKKLQTIKHIPTLPFYFKDFLLSEQDHKTTELWLIPLYTPFGLIIIPIPFRYKVRNLIAKPLTDGDFFYNVSDKFTNLFFKSNGFRIDYYDRFENPTYKQDRGTDKLLAKIDNTKKLPGMYRKRQLGAKLEPEQASLAYIERPIINNAPVGFKNVSPSTERLNTAHTQNEVSMASLAKRSFNSYSSYSSSSNPQYINKYWYKQNFSLVHMLNADLREIKHIVKMAWSYINFVADMNNVLDNVWTNITLVIPHRIPSPVMRKNIRIRRYKMTEEAKEKETRLYRCELNGNILTCWSKLKGYVCELDMESYLPNFRGEIGLSGSGSIQGSTIIAEIEGDLTKLWTFSSTKNAPINTKNTKRGSLGILDNRDYWKYYYDDTNIYPEELGGFDGREKPTIDFFSKYENYLEELLFSELLEIYNEIKQGNYIGSSRQSFFEREEEYSSLDGDSVTKEGEIQTIKSPFIPKSEGVMTGGWAIDYASTPPTFRAQKYAGSIIDPKKPIYDPNMGDNGGYRYPTELEIFMSNATISAVCYSYDLATLSYMYNKALFHMEQKNELDSNQYWFLGEDSQSNIVSKKEIIAFLVSEAKRVLNTEIPYVTTAEKYTNMLNQVNELCFKMLPKTGEYAFKRMIYDTYMVVPEEVLSSYSSVSVGLNVIRGFKGLYNNSLNITNLARTTNGSIYYYHFLPLYADFWKKLSYPNKHFLKKLYCNLETWGLGIVEEPNKTGGKIDLLKAILMSISLISMTWGAAAKGLLKGFELAIAWIGTTFTVLAIMLQAIAGVVSQGPLQNKLIKLAKGFGLAAQLTGYVNMVMNIGSALSSATTSSQSIGQQIINKVTDYVSSMTLNQALSILNQGLTVIQKLVDKHIEKELAKDAKKLQAERELSKKYQEELDTLEEDLVSIGALAKYPMNLDKFTDIDRHLSKTDLDMITYEGIEQTFDIFEQNNYLYE